MKAATPDLIKTLKQTISDAKRLKKELKSQIADLNALIARKSNAFPKKGK